MTTLKQENSCFSIAASAATNPYNLVDQINRHGDLYHVLGLSGYSLSNRHQIKLEDIRKAYLSCSRLCHPEYHPNKLPQYKPCTAAFQKLSAAYETLSNPASQKLYDLSRPVNPSFQFNTTSATPPRPPTKPQTHYKPDIYGQASNADKSLDSVSNAGEDEDNEENEENEEYEEYEESEENEEYEEYEESEEQ
ncbi:hypothetical protein PtA15_5A698 [Puccinia triticina]|uniref:J domain-containing protein n=1 Tax=Puccinia triticina TaxID=208348 RepID=A0ABY7CIS5_9BASI|nr:uncharacterized protein PtA15_5A698 [Puccinia triticina]WAQ85124.1 hypothetical protein PtA15_5A698 [Puccinia triticina]